MLDIKKNPLGGTNPPFQERLANGRRPWGQKLHVMAQTTHRLCDLETELAQLANSVKIPQTG